ncbi:MAG: GtrA family protein [bacterium]
MPTTLADRLRGPWRLIAKEVAAFGLVGAISFVIDVGLFNVLLHSGAGPITAKIVSTAVATTFAYFGNRHLSFSHRARTSLGREATYFFAINLLTLVGSLAVLAVFAYPLHYKFDKFVMNLVNLATIALGTVVRFDAYKRFVFLHPDKIAPPVDVSETAVERAA